MLGWLGLRPVLRSPQCVEGDRPREVPKGAAVVGRVGRPLG